MAHSSSRRAAVSGCPEPSARDGQGAQAGRLAAVGLPRRIDGAQAVLEPGRALEQAGQPGAQGGGVPGFHGAIVAPQRLARSHSTISSIASQSTRL